MHQVRATLSMFRHGWLALLLGLAVGLTPLARAQADVSQLSLEELGQVEVYATDRYVRQLLGAGSAGVVVTAEDIHAFGYRSLADILRSLPGLYVTYDRQYSYLGSRGYGSVGDWNSRILLLVDGQRINENIYDSGFIGNDFIVDVGLIDRVEYVAGPSAAMLYGNNAFFGVINVTTKNGLQLSGNEVALGAGSAGTYQARWSYGQRYASGLDVLLSLSRYSSHGQDLDLPELGGLARGMDGESANRFFGKFSYGEFNLEVAGNSRPKEVPNAPYAQVFGDARSRSTDDQGYVSLGYNHALGAESALSGRLFHGRYDYRQDYVYDLAAAPPAELALYQDRAAGRWWGGELKYVSASLAGHKLLLGGDFQRNSKRMQQAGYVGEVPDLDDNRSDQFWGLYLHDEWALSPELRLGLGARFDRTTLGQSELHPRMSLAWEWQPDTTLKLLYGEAFRPPNAYELYYGDGVTYVPNMDLKPESVRTVEGIVEHRWASGAHSVLTLFHNKIDDLIDYVALTADSYQLQNVRNVHTDGLELRHVHFFDNGGQLAANYTLQRTRDRSGELVQNSPRQLGKLAWRLPLPGGRAQAGLELQCIGSRWSIQSDRVAGACLANLTLSGRWQRRLDWSVTVSNVFDRAVADPSAHYLQPLTQVRQEGRGAFVQFSYRY